MAELSPMMRQYAEIKEKNKDSILFFRLGDFYEMFFEDAKIASRELDLTLTGKDYGQEERAPMCGVPYHSCEAYIARLIDKGYRVAICEQTEDPATAKGIVKRDIVRVITPGTVIEDSMLDESKNNYLAGLFFDKNSCGICFVDTSTGEVQATEVNGKNVENKVIDELARFKPREIFADDGILNRQEVKQFLREKLQCCLTLSVSGEFTLEKSEENIKNHFKISNIAEKNLIKGSPMAICVGAILDYLYSTQMSGLSRITDISIYSSEQYMKLDINATRNLELCETMRNKEKRGSLLWVLDKTKSAMGKRLIRKWIEQPLIDLMSIETRLNGVDELFGKPMVCGEIREMLSDVHDIERLMTRIVYGNASGRELRSLCFTMKQLPSIKEQLSACNSRILKGIDSDIDVLEDICSLIDNSIVDEPPVTIKEGGIIREGYDTDVDTLRNDVTNSKGVIAEVEASERDKTGIKGLKIGYNRVFGYYIEITNSYKSLVPPHYIRKQTLTNAERYITEELKHLEERVLGARERLVQLEYQIFEGIRKITAEALPRIQKTANALATLDVLCSFADVAQKNSYTRPVLNTGGTINIVGGRHPVVEKMLSKPFVPNDTLLDTTENRCAIITGPNMAGKSTYMRQVAIITLMAQIGSFVPADSAEISITDAIFTRVGASDDLSSGQSTFMVEMSEVADILKNATQKSLIVLDEIGRGTSTFDGMSIARAVLEYVNDRKKLGAKTLFATHYHEMTTLESSMSGVKNYNIAVRKNGDDITFLRKIVRGGADRSYGIEVAKLSGIPETVIKRAKEILHTIENEGIQRPESQNIDDLQFSFEMQNSKDIVDELSTIDINSMTPMECMSTLDNLIKRAKGQM